MATLQKIYRVTCKTFYEHIQTENKRKLKDKTDFINQFPTNEEIDLCIKKHDEEVDSVMNIMYRKLNTEVTITEFIKYIPSTLDILSQSNSLHNEYASLSPNAKTISSEEQKIRDEEKRLERDRKEENGEEITEDDF